MNAKRRKSMKNIVLTGASDGLGRAIATKCLKQIGGGTI